MTRRAFLLSLAALLVIPREHGAEPFVLECGAEAVLMPLIEEGAPSRS